MKSKPWTVLTAIDLAQRLELKASTLGYHIGLTGSNLFKGSSVKDVDLIVYPHDYDKNAEPDSLRNNITKAAIFLNQIGLVPRHTHPNDATYADDKVVWVCDCEGGRVDVFIMH